MFYSFCKVMIISAAYLTGFYADRAIAAPKSPVILAAAAADLRRVPPRVMSALQTRRIVVVVDGLDAIRNFPVLVAEKLGYLKGEDFSVTLMDVRPDISVDAMVADGTVDASIAYYHHTVAGTAAGTPMKAVATLGVTPGVKIMVARGARSRIRTAADLKGARIIAGGPYSAKTTVANALVIANGLSPKDYVPLLPEDKLTISKMLQNGEADVVVARTPDGQYYEREGVASLLVDLTRTDTTKRALKAPFPTTAVYMSSARIEADPAVAQFLATAFVRTLAYIRSHSPSEIATLLPARVRGKDESAFLSALTESVAMYANDGRMPAGGAEEELRVLQAAIPRYAAVKPQDTFTNTFAEKALTEIGGMVPENPK